MSSLCLHVRSNDESNRTPRETGSGKPKRRIGSPIDWIVMRFGWQEIFPIFRKYRFHVLRQSQANT